MKIYDGGKVIVGLVIFLAIALFPLYYNVFDLAQATEVPDPKTDTKAIEAMPEKRCVEPTEYMKAEHMQVLNEWRQAVVRDADRMYVDDFGQRHEMSLSNTCMECHSNKAEFCDACHDYASVSPYCWDCHIEPKENK